MNFRHIATAVTTFVAITSGTGALAQDRSLDAFDVQLATSTSSLTRAEVVAELQRYRASGLLDLQRSEAADLASNAYLQAQAKYAALASTNAVNTGKATVLPTRAEVVTDLKLYRASGLLDLQRDEMLDIFSPQYLRAQSKYAQLSAASLNGATPERVSAQSKAGETRMR